MGEQLALFFSFLPVLFGIGSPEPLIEPVNVTYECVQCISYPPLPTPTPSSTPTPKPTATPTPIPPTPSPTQAVASITIDIHATIKKYASEYSVDESLLHKLAKCESGYNANAMNGPYAGMFQYSASAWASARRRMGQNDDPALRFDAHEAIKTTAFKISVDGSGAWPSCSK